MRAYKLLLIGIVSIMFSCNSGTNKSANTELNAGTHKIEVKEVIDVTTYTYLNVEENGNEYWMAVPKQEVKAGEIYFYDNRVEMQNFESTELEKSFEMIYFVEEIRTTPMAEMPGGMGMPHGESMENMHSKHASTEVNSEIDIEPVSGGITIAELFGSREDYGNKEVLIKGKVVKVNRMIMERNWVHIQDGTDSNGNFDLTITTNDEVAVDDIVVFKGKITLNKDFGAGYSYEVIMEEAKVQ
jgi:hypothetical protein